MLESGAFSHGVLNMVYIRVFTMMGVSVRRGGYGTLFKGQFFFIELLIFVDDDIALVVGSGFVYNSFSGGGDRMVVTHRTGIVVVVYSEIGAGGSAGMR